MKEFLKENFVLALGVSLPVILIVVFMFAQSLTKLVDPPQYKAVFALQNHYHGQKPFKFKVDEQTGKLTITYTEPETPENQSRYHYNTRLYIYDPAQDNLQETELEATGVGWKKTKAPLSALRQRKILSSIRPQNRRTAISLRVTTGAAATFLPNCSVTAIIARAMRSKKTAASFRLRRHAIITATTISSDGS